MPDHLVHKCSYMAFYVSIPTHTHTRTHTHTHTDTHTQTYVAFIGLSIDQRTVDSCEYVPVGKSVRGHQNKWKDMANRVNKICSISTFDSREFLSKCFKMNTSSLRSLKDKKYECKS